MYFEKKCCVPRSQKERNYRVKSAKLSGKEKLREAKMFFSVIFIPLISFEVILAFPLPLCQIRSTYPIYLMSAAF